MFLFLFYVKFRIRSTIGEEAQLLSHNTLILNDCIYLNDSKEFLSFLLGSFSEVMTPAGLCPLDYFRTTDRA